MEEGNLRDLAFVAMKTKEASYEVDEIILEVDLEKDPFQDAKGLNFWAKLSTLVQEIRYG